MNIFLKWLIEFVCDCLGCGMVIKLVNEIMDVVKNIGGVICCKE